jgi:hypothetical protein
MLFDLPKARPSMQIRHTLVSWSFCSLFKPIVDVRSKCVEKNANKGQALEDQRRASVARVVVGLCPEAEYPKASRIARQQI